MGQCCVGPCFWMTQDDSVNLSISAMMAVIVEQPLALPVSAKCNLIYRSGLT